MVGTLYFIYFQITGFLATCLVLKNEKPFAKLVVGSALGSIIMQWSCVLTSFIFNFNVVSHIFAAAMVFPIWIISLRHHNRITNQMSGLRRDIKDNKVFVVIFFVTFVLWCRLLNTHIIPIESDGSIHTGQCTYGDMNMHLGFITSIANQSEFPPIYSIFPNIKLAYPFLSASISSSLYLFGNSLRTAYIVPMLFAFFQVCGSVYLLATTILRDKAKALLSWTLFFFNGGLGFIYFTGLVKDSPLQFSDIFTGYYTTPTNLVDYNIRWVNIIADILLPQRASLFGYATLFTAIWLLYNAVWEHKEKNFLYVAFFASALPMIHTHSFLSLALISASWLLLDLFRKTVRCNKWYGGPILIIVTLLMCVIQYFNNKKLLSSNFFFYCGIGFIIICIIYGIYLLIKYIKNNGYKSILSGWGIYLLIVLTLALPQLLLWTFGQVAEGGFLRGHFNWGNIDDFYPWFYIKNIGAPVLLIICAICKGGKTTAQLVIPASIIWIVAEFILFTPNTYDNNKLLYVAYLLFCIAGADFGIDWYFNHRGTLGKILLFGFFFISTFSAALTLSREYISDYQLYGPEHVALAEFINENTDVEAVFLTNTRHNNEIVSLTGRSIVCGSDVFLYYHGIDTTQRKNDVKLMYENILENITLYEKYSVDYVLVSSWEKGSYNIDIDLFNHLFEKVFQQDTVTLYKVTNNKHKTYQ